MKELYQNGDCFQALFIYSSTTIYFVCNYLAFTVELVLSIYRESVHEINNPQGYSPWGCKVSDMTEWLQFLSIVPFGKGNGNPLQCSCLEHHMDRGAWWAAVYGAAKSRTQLSNYQTDTYTRTRAHTHTHTGLLRYENVCSPKYDLQVAVLHWWWGNWRRRAQHCRSILVWFLRSERSDEQKLRGQASTCVFRSLPCWPKRQWYISSWAHSTCHTRHTQCGEGCQLQSCEPLFIWTNQAFPHDTLSLNFPHTWKPCLWERWLWLYLRIQQTE